MNSEETGIGRRYLEETRYRRRSMGERSLAYPRAPLYKEYPEAAQRLSLAPEAGRLPADLWQAVAARRSQRNYVDRPLTPAELAALLWATQGMTGCMGGYHFRAAPSAGALYPVETYLAVHRVEGVTPGIWHFQVVDFALELVAAGDFRQDLAAAGLSQSFLGEAGAVFIWTGVLNRARWKYRERAVRYLFLDAGHICQNLMLAATALNLGVCPVGAFFDDEVERLVGVDQQDEVALYLASVGARI
ncbi:MAG: SagB/ThcOx family dehydrogenase [Syntrophobacterales bacterium]|jgi:SagB-type dehydrogenase family enzyme|nr:SagB/ThcOx family dehydrogenase [Syntrophobacterales bacterium]